MKRFFVFFVFLLLSGCAVSGTQKEQPSAYLGMLDLSGWDFKNDGVVWLNGKWEFYYGRLLSPEDFRSGDRPSPTGYVSIPGSWDDLPFVTPKTNFATFRLIIKTEGYSGDMGVAFQNFKSIAHNLWIDGNLVSSGASNVTGIFNKLPGFYTVVDMFQPSSDTFEVILQLSNYYNVTPFSIGTENRVLYERYLFFFKTWFYFFLFGGMILMVIYHFGMFVFRKTDKAPLFFALFCLCVSYNSVGALLAAFSPIVSNGLNFYYLIVKMTPVINYLGLWALLSHYVILFPETLPSKFVKTLKIVLFSLFFAFMLMPAKWLVGLVFVIPYSFMLPAVSLFILIHIVRSQGIKKENTPITYISFFPFVIATFFTSADMVLLLMGMNGIPYYVVPTLTYAYIVFQSILLSRRTSNALSKVEEMSRDLEKLVGIRTTELEIERNRLKNQNAVMQDELNLARRIQMKFIPSEAPDNIAFHYKPMYQIGGDYFDFIRRSDGRIGIFISDVSGHGVPAAFVTSMIKSFSLEHTEVIKSPSEFLMQLNDFLLPMTAGNFITAFYAIYDPLKKTLEYSNAGHNPPLLLSGDSISSIYVKNGFPLAVTSGNEMKKMNKNYRDSSIELKCKDKAFFYTDGLTEAVSVYQSDAENTAWVADFEAIGLLPTLNEARDGDADTLIHKVMERLTQFRGADVFDDDVCIICLEAADDEAEPEV